MTERGVTDCGWEYPLRRADGTVGRCEAPGVIAVISRPTGERRSRCVNHAMRDVAGGQWSYAPAPEPAEGR